MVESKECKKVLAQYTIRSKQDYIFKTNRVLEIVGASENIARIWDVLFEVAKEKYLKFERTDKKYIQTDIDKKFDERQLNFVELFCGGGNETILFDSIESFMNLNRAFSYKLISDYPGMIPMAVCVEVTGNYSEDYRSLMEKADKKKNIMEPQWDMFTVPFAMIDRTTFQPYSKKVTIEKSEVRMSDESYGKYKVGQELRDANDDIKFFDEIITKKGNESLLAVVHADGNNMGAKIMGMLHGETSYEKAVSMMRNFTKTTADCFETKGEEALKICQERLKNENEKLIKQGKLKESGLAYRKLIGSGDDMTFICNARFVMDYVSAYLNAVQDYNKNNKSDWVYSSCAGICIFHSHYPFSKAYSIAEQACDEAKKKVHIVDENGKLVNVEQGWFDFHFIHSGIGGNLEEIRRSQGTKECMARPWLVTSHDKHDNDVYKYDDLLELKKVMKNVARTSIKTIGSAYEKSASAAKKELIALYGHTAGLEGSIKKIYFDENVFLKALYDFGEIYDLWFTEVK